MLRFQINLGAVEKGHVMEAETVGLEIDARGVARVSLRRPHKHNALSRRMIGELESAALRLGADDSVRAVVLVGEGKSFCAGADLDWMKAQIAADSETRRNEALMLARMFIAWNKCMKPVIACVHGGTFGGGIGLISTADTVIAAPQSRFGLTEARLGLIPATISPFVIGKIGHASALRLFMTARRFGPVQAKEYGLVTLVAELPELDEKIEAELECYLACAPGAVAASKALAQSYGPVIDEALIARNAENLTKRWDSDECKEGIAAFFERRNPAWAAENEGGKARI